MNMRTSSKEAIGESPEFLDFQQRLSKAAEIDRPILLIGERGSGKELAASRLHYLSKRWDEPFITLNCAALNPNLIETELFGHIAGAYTGAVGKKKGRFEEAHKGTLFLDEIGLIPMEVQAKILRVVEYGVFERVGSSDPIKVDVRIIGATNADLHQMAQEEKFKPDLLDRLSFEVIFLPPLRFRQEDIILLASFFASNMASELDREGFIEFSDEVIQQMTEYSWPGNIRELKNVIERAVYTAGSEVIENININPFSNPYIKSENKTETSEEKAPLSSFKDSIKDMEIDFIQRALKEADSNQKNAASLLNISYDQFRGIYRKYKDML